jgi:extracellular elastinolytic metalloproteinase
MQLYLFQKASYAPGWVSGNAGDDASIVYHEYTHGLTSRLVTYPSGLAALNTWQSGAMGEAWSDWYAMDLLEADGYQTDTATVGDVKVGRYITGGKGIRSQPLDCVPSAGGGRCPAGASSGGGGYTLGDFTHIARGPEVHADGEIWGQTLWQLRRELIAQLGREEGIRTARRLVTRALQLSPPDPTFLDQRNAILQADTVAHAGDHHELLWTVFAKRGMGFFASTLGGDDLNPTESFATPPSCADGGCGRIHGRITDALTGKPVKGVLVGLGGHRSGFPGTDLVTTTDHDGQFEIRKVPFHTYADVVIDRAGFEPLVLHGFRVDGDERLRRGIVRDWAAIDGGARLVKFTPPNYTSFGCGPRGAIDRALDAGWGSDAPHSRVGSNVTGSRTIVVELSRAVDVTAFAVDPAATCGDYRAAGVKAFDIYTRTAKGSWSRVASVAGGLPQGRLSRVVPRVRPDRVRFVKLVMRSNHGDPYFMDMTEISVRGRPS